MVVPSNKNDPTVSEIKAARGAVSFNRDLVDHRDISTSHGHLPTNVEVYIDRAQKVLDKLAKSDNPNLTPEQRSQFLEAKEKLSAAEKSGNTAAIKEAFDRAIIKIQGSAGIVVQKNDKGELEYHLVVGNPNVHLMTDAVIGPRTETLMSLILGEPPTVSAGVFVSITGNRYNFQDYIYTENGKPVLLNGYDQGDFHVQYPVEIGEINSYELQRYGDNPILRRGRIPLSVNPFFKWIMAYSGDNLEFAHLIHCVMMQENGWNIEKVRRIHQMGGTDVKSWAGALGLMQFMPGTAAGYGLRDPAHNNEGSIHAAARYLSTLTKRFNGNYLMAAAGYNCGEGRVSSLVREYGANWVNHLPRETQLYVMNLSRQGVR